MTVLTYVEKMKCQLNSFPFFHGYVPGTVGPLGIAFRKVGGHEAARSVVQDGDFRANLEFNVELLQVNRVRMYFSYHFLPLLHHRLPLHQEVVD